MKRNNILSAMATTLFVVLMFVGEMMGQEIGLGKRQAKMFKMYSKKPVPTASEILEKTISGIEDGLFPLEIYPPGYFDQLLSKGDGPMMEMMMFSAGASALTAGDIGNMSWIPPGTFMMGSPTNEAQRESNEIQHAVIISYGFYMGKYQVTQGEYLAVIGYNPSLYTSVNGYTGDLNRPVEQVAWTEATNYCSQLTQQERLAGRIPSDWAYRLPTEAEWEYSCRAGTTTAFSFGNSIHGGDANFDNHFEYNSTNGTAHIFNPPITPLFQTMTVGSYNPNPFDLYDMHGNVWEWCQDWVGIYPSGNVIDPKGPVNGSVRALRGGSYASFGRECRSAYRYYAVPNFSNPSIGFRIVLAPVVAGWNQVITNMPLEKTYGTLPARQSGKYNLILVTHGWNPDLTWVRAMTNNIHQYLISHGLTTWQVTAYEWPEEAETVFPQKALRNGKQDGYKVGKQIVANGWTNIHFIAHSAGAGLINTASEFMYTNAAHITVHNTFLDAFIGNWAEEKEEYGKYANWADNYFSSADSPRTQAILPHAFNVDVTQLNKVTQLGAFISSGENVGAPCIRTVSSHSWAHGFYSNTITGTITTQYNGFGFPVSKEGGGWNFALANYVKGGSTNLGSQDQNCISLATATPEQVLNVIVAGSPVVEFGEVDKYFSGLKLTSHSPAWASIAVNHTNAVNFVSFDMKFVSTNSNAKGLLSAYWDSEVLGSIDEQAVLPGFRRYTYTFPITQTNGLNMLGFRIDPFTNMQSIVVVTNVVVGISGPSQPFRLLVTTNTVNNIPVMELIGQSHFNYVIEMSTNLIQWQPIAWLVNTNGSVRFFDQKATNRIPRFYRAAVFP